MAFPTSSFGAATLRRPVETVQQLLRAAGIAQQVTLYFPFPWMAALTAYALCPAGLVLLAAARTLGGRVRRGCPKETCWFVLGGAFLLALVLPALLRLLPPWITPPGGATFPLGRLLRSGQSHRNRLFPEPLCQGCPRQMEHAGASHCRNARQCCGRKADASAGSKKTPQICPKPPRTLSYA